MASTEFDPVMSRSLVASDATSWSRSSGVSWGAILAGAAAAAALSLILVILGVGLGFTAISPWSSTGATAKTMGISAAIWLAFTQIAASGLGGYMAGRLRVKWTDVHTDEVYFRDTAHGMLSWAVSSLVTAALLGSVLTGIASAGAQAAGNVATSTVSVLQSAASNTDNDSKNGALSYTVDSLFRSDQPATEESGGDAQREAATILVHSIGAGSLDAQDKTYLARLVAQQTGLSQADAEKRVDDLYNQATQAIEQAKTKAKEAADAARKAAAMAALWTFVALLCGAFVASVAALWGGRQRDLAVLDNSRTAII